MFIICYNILVIQEEHNQLRTEVREFRQSLRDDEKRDLFMDVLFEELERYF